MKRWLLALSTSCIVVLVGTEAQSGAPDGSVAAGPRPVAAFIAETEALTVSDVVRLLGTPDDPAMQASRTRTRAIRLTDGEPPAQLPERFRPGRTITSTVARAGARVNSNGAIAIPLRFNFSSTDVHASGTQHLDTIAAGIRRLPPGAIVFIEGHTDAHGPDALNNELSLKRALVVRNYLIRQHQIPGAMLVAIGRGKNAPLIAENPWASANRRVEFRAEYEVRPATENTADSDAKELAKMVLGQPATEP